ncbi:MAG: phage portal protein [Anaerolineae bacterium]|nr:phage portal protein [Anaerolineae bacterium]
MFNWLSNIFSDRQQLRSDTPHVEAVAVHNSALYNDALSAASNGEIYQQSPWIYVAVNRIAEAGALVPLRVLRLDGERRLQVDRHPLEVLLDAPNPFLSRFELFEQTLGMLELTGNAYWYLTGNNRGQPAQIWPLRADRVSIVPDPQGYVRGYVYEVDGKRIPYEPLEIVHFKRWHPANDYYGLSALSAARLAISSDRAMARWNHNTFGQDNGVPAGIVAIQDNITDGDFERIKREWRSSYGGAQRKTAFLRGGTVTWQNIGLSHTDLDFLKGRQAHRDEILNIFGIPVGLVSENATEANAKVAERQFIERTLWPKLVRLAQKITQELLPFYPGEHIAEFEDIRPTDTQARLDEIRTAQAVLSINEIRARYYDLPSAPWGEVPVSLARQDAVRQRLTPTPMLPDPDSDDEVQTASAAKSQADELAQWERFALKRLGRPVGRPFEVTVIPDELAFEISAKLLAVDSKEAIKAVFEEVKAPLEDADMAETSEDAAE